MPNTTPTIIWFRKDLRLADNSALAAAIEVGEPILPVFIWSPEEADRWAPGAASKWWLHHSLQSLADTISEHGGQLVLREGESLSVLRELIEETGANRVHWNRRYESPLRELDASIKKELREDGVEVESFNSSLLNEPHTASTGEGKPYKVYTPYWKKVKDREIESPANVDLSSLSFADKPSESLNLESLKLLPEINWDTEFYEHWEVSEGAAMKRLDAFLSGPVEAYATDRDRPDFDGTSSLSPYLHWGQIGPRQIVHQLKKKCNLLKKGPSTYLKEVYWREFAYNVLYHFPNTPDEPLRSEYSSFPWQYDEEVLKAWQTGNTGYPIVDAGMRQLWQTGWMHNRVRMIVSSLLVKHLLHNWHEGAKWFWYTLVDADLASNTLGWQWSGGCGADAAPYFRVFNPIIQGEKFDPDGKYVKRYVPELEKIPTKYIHTPWEAPEGILKHANVEIGEDYPAPIIDHKEGRERALAALDQFKG
ncbi:MAG TPA: deoxyribodipyrimidine photolyase [Opitutae bacterium]|nr:deoxyribodipyrimidine photolyase [Opitutae bacterium]